MTKRGQIYFTIYNIAHLFILEVRQRFKKNR